MEGIKEIAGDIGHGIEKGAEAVAEGAETAAKDIAKVIGIAEKTEAVVTTAVKDEAVLKPVLVKLGKDAVALSAKFSAVYAAKGLDWKADTDLEASLVAFFQTDIEGIMVPAIVKVYDDEKAVIEGAASTAVDQADGATS